MDLTDEQWGILEPLIPVPPRRSDGEGRSWRDARYALKDILPICAPELPGATCPSASLPTKGEKRGGSVGKTKWSKGAKLMALADAFLFSYLRMRGER